MTTSFNIANSLCFGCEAVGGVRGSAPEKFPFCLRNISDPEMCDTCGEMASDGAWCCNCGAIQGAPFEPGRPPVEWIGNLNPCGFTGSEDCFDCQSCSGRPGDTPAVRVRYLGQKAHVTVTGDEAARLQSEHGLESW